MVTETDVAQEKFENVISTLIDAARVAQNDGEIIHQDYCNFIDSIPELGTAQFLSFKKCKERVDEFLLSHITTPKLVSVIRFLLVIFHGQAGVERGFSVNKQIVVDSFH